MNAGANSSDERWEHASALLEAALARDAVLRPAQRANARAKARDLHTGRLRWQSVPFRLMVEFNRRCNTRCRMCPIVHSPTGGFSVERFEALLEEIGWGVFELVPFLSGEPTLAPLERLAALLRRHGVYYNLTTNGAELTPELLASIEDCTSRILFSMQSHRREVQEHLMPGLSFDRIATHVRNAVARAEVHGFQVACATVVMDANLRGLEDHARFLAAMGVQRWILQRLYPWVGVHEEQVRRAEFTAAERDERVWRTVELAARLGLRVESNYGRGIPAVHGAHLKSRFELLDEQGHIATLFRPGTCISLATTSILAADGTMRPCCHHPIVLGDLGTAAFDDIWNGGPMQTLRAEFFRKSLNAACGSCMTFRGESQAAESWWKSQHSERATAEAGT